MKGDLFLSRCSVNAVLAILRVIFVAKPIFQQDGTSAALQWNLDQGIRLSSKWIDGFRTEPNIQNNGVLSFTTLQNLDQ